MLMLLNKHINFLRICKISLLFFLICFNSVRTSEKCFQNSVTASDGFDNFGDKIQINGDYAIIGSSGSAYIFHRTSGNEWVEEAILKPSVISSDGFGCSVDISGDYAIVGAMFDDENGNAAGAVYIFHRTGGSTWVEENKLIDENYGFEKESDRFGNSVSISGDYAIVGAFWLGTYTQKHFGAIFIFHRESGSNWVQQTQIKGGEWDYLGTSVEIDGDYAIASSRDGIYIYHRTSGSTWVEQIHFGSTILPVSISGQRAMFGTTIFNLTGSNWVKEDELKDPHNDPYLAFGTTVSIKGNHIIVGGFGSDNGEDNNNVGEYNKVFIFHKVGGKWIEENMILTNRSVQIITVAVSDSGEFFAFEGRLGGATGKVIFFQNICTGINQVGNAECNDCVCDGNWVDNNLDGDCTVCGLSCGSHTIGKDSECEHCICQEGNWFDGNLDGNCDDCGLTCGVNAVVLDNQMCDSCVCNGSWTLNEYGNCEVCGLSCKGSAFEPNYYCTECICETDGEQNPQAICDMDLFFQPLGISYIGGIVIIFLSSLCLCFSTLFIIIIISGYICNFGSGECFPGGVIKLKKPESIERCENSFREWWARTVLCGYPGDECLKRLFYPCFCCGKKRGKCFKPKMPITEFGPKMNGEYCLRIIRGICEKIQKVDNVVCEIHWKDMYECKKHGIICDSNVFKYERYGEFYCYLCMSRKKYNNAVLQINKEIVASNKSTNESLAFNNQQRRNEINTITKRMDEMVGNLGYMIMGNDTLRGINDIHNQEDQKIRSYLKSEINYFPGTSKEEKNSLNKKLYHDRNVSSHNDDSSNSDFDDIEIQNVHLQDEIEMDSQEEKTKFNSSSDEKTNSSNEEDSDESL